MTITAQIGATFESLLLDAPIGLIGQLGWSLMDPATETLVVERRTSRITEPSPGTYFTTETAPLTADEYLIIWDYSGTDASEDLVVQVAPIISSRYATVTDLRNYSTELVASYTDDELNNTLRDAERWIDSYVPPMLIDPTTGLKYSPPDMNPVQAIQLNYATCAQAEYILQMGPGFFISGSTTITGGDYQETHAPKLAPKAKIHLLQGYLIKLTGRVNPWYWGTGRYGWPTNWPVPISGFPPGFIF
jgi:hypothetical protein